MAAVTVLVAPLDRISREACPYPADMLANCDTGLCLFAAAFLGHNDAIHFARQDVATTCVDQDSRRLAEMQGIYPAGWVFLAADSWRYAEASRDAGLMWDAVSVDTWTGDACQRSMDSLDLWCSLARRCVTVTIPAGATPPVPAGWNHYEYPRSERASWLVMQRA